MNTRTGSVILGTAVFVLASCAMTPSGTETTVKVEPTAGGWWPQSNLQEVRAAQELADAGDPAYTWQVDATLAGDAAPWGAELFTRFLEEKLGWEEFVGGWDGSGYGSMGPGGGVYMGVTFLRCEPGRTNPLSALFGDMPPQIHRCAPTIDDLSYETVSINVSQPGRRGPDGIWVVNRWELKQSPSNEPGSLFGLLYPEFDGRVEQDIPPTESEVSALLETFLQARLDGEGAEQYLLREPDQSFFPDHEVPLLYATIGGAPFERFEFEKLQGPVWPTGWSEYRVRLFAGNGTVVEQRFHVVHPERQLGLVYGQVYDGYPTTENGVPVPVPFRILDGEVTFAATPPWKLHWAEDPTVMTLNRRQNENVVIAVDPLTTGAGCENGPAVADAETLAQSIATDPDFVTIGTTPVRIAGVEGLQIDLDVVTAGGTVCFWNHWVLEVQPIPEVGYGDFRMRLYLIDYPGESAQVLAIAIIAPEEAFERVLEAASPIVNSLEIHTR